MPPIVTHALQAPRRSGGLPVRPSGLHGAHASTHRQRHAVSGGREATAVTEPTTNKAITTVPITRTILVSLRQVSRYASACSIGPQGAERALGPRDRAYRRPVRSFLGTKQPRTRQTRPPSQACRQSVMQWQARPCAHGRSGRATAIRR